MMKTEHLHFEDMLALAEAKPTEKNKYCFMRIEGKDNENTTENKHWYGVKNGIEGVKEIVSQGWQDGRKKIEKLAGEIALPPAQSIKRRTVRGASGQTLNMAAVYSGNLSKCWSSRRRSGSAGISKVTILASVGDHADVGSDILFWRGAAACKAAEIVAAAGYAVRITGYTNIKGHFNDGGNAVYSYNVKAHQEAMDTHRLATILALGGFFRYFVFKGFCTNEKEVSSGYGTPIKETPKELKTASAPDFIIDGFESVYDLASAQKFITEKINILQGA